jgi:membrane-bound ClpP family serine protease
MRPLDQYIQKQLETHIDKLENILKADIITIISPIVPGLENIVRDAIESNPAKKERIAIVLDTPGGVVEVVERMVDTVRHHYKEVTFIIPNVAMSAGTIFVMSGDQIMMDYFSCLGPIDPQVYKDGNLVPALSYILKFKELNAKAAIGELTTAEYALISKLDLCELHQFEQARELSIDLLKKWLSKYKFKNWTETETRKQPVTPTMREERALEIAENLNKVEKWHSHGRSINMQTLREELKLRIDDFSEKEGLKETVRGYFELLQDYMMREEMQSFVHTRHSSHYFYRV